MRLPIFKGEKKKNKKPCHNPRVNTYLFEHFLCSQPYFFGTFWSDSGMLVHHVNSVFKILNEHIAFLIFFVMFYKQSI